MVGAKFCEGIANDDSQGRVVGRFNSPDLYGLHAAKIRTQCQAESVEGGFIDHIKGYSAPSGLPLCRNECRQILLPCRGNPLRCSDLKEPVEAALTYQRHNTIQKYIANEEDTKEDLNRAFHKKAND